ncbi:MAG: VTT domain-containing protein [Acidobacteria bacterium]|nr:VTT domain-containing protein [Acidobacteriota bacterium]
MPRRALLRFLLLPALLAGVYAVLHWTPLGGYLSAPVLEAALTRLRRSWWTPALLVLGYLVLSPLGVPATPLMIVGGVVFGATAGSLYNIAGVIVGGAATYFLGRLLGRDLVRHVAGRRLRKVELAIGRRGFWNLVALRFLPLPFAMVNYGAALAGVRPALFLATTVIGIIPTVTIYTYFIAAVARAAASHHGNVYSEVSAQLPRLVVPMALLLLVTLVPQWVRARRRRRRLAELREVRRQRGAGGRQD